MIDHTPKLDRSRGAPMGRGFRSDESWRKHGSPFLYGSAKRDREFTGKVSLRRIPLDSGGYDAGGAYWGFGEPIYSALSECGTVDMTMRASTRDAAKVEVLKEHPKARFYR